MKGYRIKLKIQPWYFFCKKIIINKTCGHVKEALQSIMSVTDKPQGPLVLYKKQV